MPAYDRSFSPPAPVADVVLVHPVSGRRSDVVPGKLDTGADLTVIPESIIAQLGLVSQASIWAKSYDGTYSERAAYYAGMVLDGKVITVVRCIAANRVSVLVGPNVLNRFVLTLNGPRLKFDLQQSRS